MTNLLWSGFLILLLVSGCGYDGAPTRHNDFVPLTSIEIVPEAPGIAASRTIAPLTSTRLTVKGNYSGLFTRDITDQATWTSASPAVAGFVFTAAPNKNRVKGLATGTSILTATVGSVSSTYTLTVSSATISTVTITPDAALLPPLPKGRTTQFAASGIFSDLSTQELTFDTAWTSNNTAVATVSDAEGSKGLAKAEAAAGSATITATFGSAPATASGSTTLTVSDAVVQSIAISPANPSALSLSTTAGFTASGTFSDGSTKDITSQVTWSTSNSAIATIATTGGAARALTQGATTISAVPLPALPADPGVSGSTTLKVTGGNLSSVALSIANKTAVNGGILLAKDTLGRLTAIGSFSNGSSRDITGALSWSVDPSPSGIATLSTPAGNLVWFNALAVTPATPATFIKATFENLTISTSLTVSPATLSSIVISPVALNITAGTTARFSTIGTFSDGTTQDVTASTGWTSGTPATATVGDSATDPVNKGRVTGVAGSLIEATITAAHAGVTNFTAPVLVSGRTIQSLTITPASASVAAGNQVRFTATANYQGFSQDVTEDTSWSIENKPYVAILADSQHQPGQIVAVNSGTAVLTATFGGLTVPVTITVP